MLVSPDPRIFCLNLEIWQAQKIKIDKIESQVASAAEADVELDSQGFD